MPSSSPSSANIPSRDTDTDTHTHTTISHLWTTQLEPALTQILDTGGPLPLGSAMSWTVLYSEIYGCCTRAARHRAELYAKLAPFYQAYTARIYADAPPADDDDTVNALLVDFYNTQWDRFHRGATRVDELFTYLNRHFVRAAAAKRTDGVVSVPVVNWKTQVFEPVARRLCPLRESTGAAAESSLGLDSEVTRIRGRLDSASGGKLTGAELELEEMRVQPELPT
ncbi:hypothetical protein B0H12DRAFT_1244718 [Mycena haematopus]|nr:hypothetical protein B0H12DRAFT_1244718 [Mycena haematopus]